MAPDNRERLVASLQRDAAYPHPVDGVEHIETHISDVFLAGEFAYKVKKSVDFGFCDFSTRDLRERFTLRELELNQRLSKGVYLSVEEVRRDPATGEFSINGEGEPVEPALRMRRLSSADRLDRLLRAGASGERDIREIAAILARFHRDAASARGRFAGPEQVAEIVLGNIARVREHGASFLPAAAPADADGFASAFIAVRRELLQGRYESGMPRMCHGDLHAGNIFLEETPEGGRAVQVIDCIEFNDSLIYIDPAADIAFLTMDLKRLGLTGFADLLKRSYIELSGDSALRRVILFYESYRAMVRCLAACISAEQAGDDERGHGSRDEALAYLRLATDIAAEERPQFLAITSGLTGTGKSTVAAVVAEQWDAVHLKTDVIRKELAGLRPGERTSDAVRAGIYSSDMSRRTYSEMRRRAEAALSQGRSVIMDGTHLQARSRAESLSAAGMTGARTIIIECSLDERTALRRLRERYDAGVSESEGRPEVYFAQKPEWQPAALHEADVLVHVETSQPHQALTNTLFSPLWRGLFNTVA